MPRICTNPDGDICICPSTGGVHGGSSNDCNGCNPPLPEYVTVTISGLSGALAAMNGSYVVPYKTGVSCVNDNTPDGWPPVSISNFALILMGYCSGPCTYAGESFEDEWWVDIGLIISVAGSIVTDAVYILSGGGGECDVDFAGRPVVCYATAGSGVCGDAAGATVSVSS